MACIFTKKSRTIDPNLRMSHQEGKGRHGDGGKGLQLEEEERKGDGSHTSG